MFQVPTADGQGMRDARLSDVDKLDLYVSVTEKIKSTLHPGWGLINWMVGLPLEIAVSNAETLVNLYAKDPAKWAKEVNRLTWEAKQKAPSIGTNIHGIIERYFKWEATDRGHDFYVDEEYIPLLKCVETFVKENNIFPISTDYLEKVVVNHETKDAGTLDFKGKGFECDRVYIDWKTQRVKKDKPNFYKEWGYQLAQYCASDNNNTIPKDARLFNVVISTAGFGDSGYIPKIYLKEWKQKEKLKSIYDDISNMFFRLGEDID